MDINTGLIRNGVNILREKMKKTKRFTAQNTARGNHLRKKEEPVTRKRKGKARKKERVLLLFIKISCKN